MTDAGPTRAVRRGETFHVHRTACRVEPGPGGLIMARIAYLTVIDFGPGEIASLAAACAELGIARPLLVSDHGLAASGLLDRARPAMPPAATFLDTPTNPT